ncbi:hypothetical protein OMP40_23860 [Cohnella rhizosphaerae]|uniref:Uncharacterized protein n=1 Tax=Cohnella rhizosphaerae TaxID=1457232 RepID=A0A9X4KVR1_9BACL|nr:hypothetical protein [Cohnella rhizosphaerae]MDG0812059.1 hypothetical protein [Cohnella rhizosphaerae]
MDKAAVKRFYDLKSKQKEIEKELSELRGQILTYCEIEGLSQADVGGYSVKIVQQERREYDDEKLKAALPDDELWRLVSRADASKLAGLVKLNVLKEEQLFGTYSLKKIALVNVERE